MGKIETIKVAMPEEVAARMRAAVDAGDYPTEGEIVREMMREWVDRQDREAAKLEWLKAEIQKGLDCPSRPADEVFEEVLAELRQKIVSEKKSAA